MALICDTGPLLAALDTADRDHAACANLLQEGLEDLVVPMLVLAEVDYWCHKRLGLNSWLIFLDDLLAGAYRCVPPSPVELTRCRDLQNSYADLNLGIVDASVVALAERLGERKIATLDHRHFATLRPLHAPAFDLKP